ncbi:hypothetical protein GCM10010302_30380 [Streptomyces polychromogenes]|uniref:DUF3592 domain-containing protein n=1 Tax=Streptomyces polychromogenes TaxID=67342 RepID=A0ABP3F4H5_9ACTN
MRYRTRDDHDGATYHHPVIAWTTRDGRACEHSSRLGRGTPRIPVGNSVTLRYDLEDPSRFAIQGWDSTTAYRVFTVLGTALTAGGLVTLLLTTW